MSLAQISDVHCNSYNIIEIKGKKINARLKTVGGGYVDLKEIVKRTEILQTSDISQYNDSLAR